MDSERWNCVLLEWVNCLKLCKNLQKDLAELRSGEFFNALRQLIFKSSETNEDILTFIFKLLGKHYPAYKIENCNEIHLSDLSQIDLKAIVSLLLHYTCIFDRRDVLTSPLCHSLSQSTQLILRNFFQHINNKTVTVNVLNEIIKQCVCESTETLTNQWLSSVNCSASSKQSPLLDMLKTPMSKIGKLREKDKLIASLKADLDVERYEKVDLQDELKSQREKNKRIEKQLLQKTSEISRLRGEVAALENRTPPHYQDRETRQVQKRLEIEIQSLEDYVRQIESEQDNIKIERDAARNKVRTLETMCKEWQEKFFEIEQNYDKLREQIEQKDIDLANLEEHCNELTMMLDEFKSKANCNDENSIYNNSTTSTIAGNRTFESTSIICEEDLAGSVVEVQLRDAQKLNDELKIQINELTLKENLLETNIEKFKLELTERKEICDKLTVELENSKSNYELIQETLRKTEIDLKSYQSQLEQQISMNENLQTEIQTSKMEKENILQELDKSKQSLQKSIDYNNNLESEMKTIQESLDSTLAEKENITSQLKKLQDSHKQLIKQFEKSSQDLVITEMLLHAKQQEMEKLTSEHSDLQVVLTLTQKQLEEADKQFNNCQIQLDEQTKSSDVLIQNLNRQLSEHKQNCEKLVDDQRLLSFELEEFRQKCNKSNEKIVNLEEINVNLMFKISEMEILIANLQVENKNVSKDFVELAECNKITQTQLEEATKQLEECKLKYNQQEIEYSQTRAELIESKLACDGLINENKQREIDFKEKLERMQNESKKEIKLIAEEKADVEQRLSNIQCEYDEMEEKFINSTDDLAITKDKVVQLEKELNQLIRNYSKLSKINEENRMKLGRVNEENANIKEGIALKQSKIEELDKLNDDLRKSQEKIEEQLAKALKGEKESQIRYGIASVAFDHLIMDTKIEIDCMKEFESEELKDLHRKQINEQKREISEIFNMEEEEISALDIMTKKHELEQHIKTILNEMNVHVEKLSKSEKSLKENAETISKLEHNYNKTIDLLKVSELKVSELRSQIEQYKNDEELQLKEMTRMKESLLKIVVQLDNDRKEKEELSAQIQRLELNLNNNENQTKRDLEEARQCCENYREKIEKNEKYCDELEEKLKLLENEKNQLHNINEKIVMDLNEMENNLENSTKQCAEYQAIQSELERKLEEEQIALEMYKQQIETHEKINKELSETIKSVQLERDQFKKECDELSEINGQIAKELQDTKEFYENNLVESNLKLKELYDENNNIEKQCEEMKASLSDRDEIIKELEISRKLLEENNEKFIKAEAQLLLQLKSLEEEKNMIEQKCVEISQNLEKSEKQTLDTISKKSALEQELMDARNLSQKCREDLECFRAENEKIHGLLEETRSTLASIENEKDGIVDKLREINEKCASLTKEKEGLLLKVNELENEKVEEINVLTDQIANLQEQIDKLHDERAAQEKKVEIYEMMTNDLQDKIKLLEETVQDYEITISGLKNAIEENLEIVSNLRKQNKEITDVQNVLIKSSSEQNELIRSLQDYLKQIEAITNSNSDNDILQQIKNIVNKNTEISEELEATKLKCHQVEEAKKEFEMKNNMLTTQMETLAIKVKNEKTDKENILTSSNKQTSVGGGKTLDEFKKENMLLKKKLVLTENSKNNIEKVLKELRQQQKTATINANLNLEYEQLLQEHSKLKRDHQDISKDYKEIVQQFEQLKSKKIASEDNSKIEEDLRKLREAYGNVVGAKSKLELENVTLRKMIEDKNDDIVNYQHIKDAYEKLLEENNKLQTEIDTIKYKRMRDKDEYVRLLKKEREETQSIESKNIQEIRTAYEVKMEKMKEKILAVCREELNREMQKLKEFKQENVTLSQNIAALKNELSKADQKIQFLEMECDLIKTKQNNELELYETRDSLRNMKNDFIGNDRRGSIISRSSRDSLLSHQKQSISRLTTFTRDNDQRRVSTLPRQAALLEEITISRRTSIGSVPANIGQNLQMEDEEDLFNDKYLTDLKEGRCSTQAGHDSNNRYSELAWRNSMVPPHLKSSYPAETQFASPNRFKEEDLKSNNINFEDSLCKLLPGEKAKKKDFGTTSYKRPGPPTPSKNGGRLSLQGNEVHPIREHCETKTPKRSTPNRIKALFTSRNSVSHADSQSSSTPNRTGRRLNIFRKPK